MIACMFRATSKTKSFTASRTVLALTLLSATAFALAQNANDRLGVEVNGKWGFINTSGRLVIPADFDFAWGFSEGLASAWKDGKAGYIDESGKFVIPPQF